jgi:hypothetical protein
MRQPAAPSGYRLHGFADEVLKMAKLTDHEKHADPKGDFLEAHKEVNYIFGGPNLYEPKMAKLTDHEKHADPNGDFLFLKTFEQMGLSRSLMHPSRAPCHGVVPRTAATPIGQISLSITIGTW